MRRPSRWRSEGIRPPRQPMLDHRFPRSYLTVSVRSLLSPHRIDWNVGLLRSGTQSFLRSLSPSYTPRTACTSHSPVVILSVPSHRRASVVMRRIGSVDKGTPALFGRIDLMPCSAGNLAPPEDPRKAARETKCARTPLEVSIRQGALVFHRDSTCRPARRGPPRAIKTSRLHSQRSPCMYNPPLVLLIAVNHKPSRPLTPNPAPPARFQIPAIRPSFPRQPLLVV